MTYERFCQMLNRFHMTQTRELLKLGQTTKYSYRSDSSFGAVVIIIVCAKKMQT